MYGETWYAHKDPQRETIKGRSPTNEYGEYAENTYYRKHHLPQKKMGNHEYTAVRGQRAD